MICLVTGATGFIGRALCAALHNQGHVVRAVSHAATALPDGTPAHPLDLARQGVPPELLEGVQTVFHLAGIAHQRAADHAYAAVNHAATVQLARDALNAGVERLVFISSIRAMGAPDGARPRGEMDCVMPADPYGLSKWRAEVDLRAQFGDSPMAIAIVRPALVYGERAAGNLALLQRAVRWGLPRPPAGGGRSMIALADLVDLLLLVAAAPRDSLATWIACDGERYSTRRIYDLLRKRAGRGPGRAWCPRWLWRLAASGHDILLPSTESVWDKLFATDLYSNRAACRDLGWTPRLTLEAVLAADAGGSET